MLVFVSDWSVMLLENVNSCVIVSIAQVTYLTEPMLMIVLGIALLIIVQGVRQWMKNKVKS